MEVCVQGVHEPCHFFEFCCLYISLSSTTSPEDIPEPVSSVEDEDVLVLAKDMIEAFLSEKLEDVDLGNV